MKDVNDPLFLLKQSVGHELPGLGSSCVVHDGGRCSGSQGGKEEKVVYKQSLAGGEGGTIWIDGERALQAGEQQVQRP